MDLKLASLNINGLNLVEKQRLLHMYMCQHKIQIMFLQEHNIKEDSKI